jgi:hypothetical protein
MDPFHGRNPEGQVIIVVDYSFLRTSGMLLAWVPVEHLD